MPWNQTKPAPQSERNGKYRELQKKKEDMQIKS